jgi:hypothetical protein
VKRGATAMPAHAAGFVPLAERDEHFQFSEEKHERCGRGAMGKDAKGAVADDFALRKTDTGRTPVDGFLSHIYRAG